MSTQDSDFTATGPGPYGFDSSPILQFGVRGRGQITGVYGQAGAYGVYGQGIMGVYAEGTVNGVKGLAKQGVGIVGQCGSVAPPVPFRATAAGVFGWSDFAPGVVGASNASAGVLGFSTDGAAVRGFSRNGFGLTAHSNHGIDVEGTAFNGVAVRGEAGDAISLAGEFQGTVVINGDLAIGGALTVQGANPKAAAVPFPDGSQRLLYCMESPELWFEDFGSAKLRRGRATVQLKDFGNAIVTSDYRVFLTPEGDCNGLYVARKRGSAFEVRELGGSTSNVPFSYRIVGRRNDIKGRRRFDKFEMPEVPALPKMDGDKHVLARRSPPKMPAPSAAMLRLLAKAEKETRALTQAGRKGGRKSVAKPRRA